MFLGQCCGLAEDTNWEYSAEEPCTSDCCWDEPVKQNGQVGYRRHWVYVPKRVLPVVQQMIEQRQPIEGGWRRWQGRSGIRTRSSRDVDQPDFCVCAGFLAPGPGVPDPEAAVDPTSPGQPPFSPASTSGSISVCPTTSWGYRARIIGMGQGSGARARVHRPSLLGVPPGPNRGCVAVVAAWIATARGRWDCDRCWAEPQGSPEPLGV